MTAIEFWAAAARVLHVDVSNVQAGPECEGKPGCDVERIRCVEAVIVIEGSKFDWPKKHHVLGSSRGVCEVMDDRTGPSDGGIRAHKEIRIDVSQSAVRVKRDRAVVNAGTRNKIVIVLQQLRCVRGLQ